MPGIGQRRAAGVTKSASDVLQFLILYAKEEISDRKFYFAGYLFETLLAIALID